MRLFLQEAQTGRRIDHPHVVRTLDSGVHGEQAWVAMEMVHGETLADRIARAPLDADAIETLAAQLAQGLQAIHGAHLVHRDVKPSNIMLTDRGAVLMDLGLAHDTRRPAAAQTFHGSFRYAPPEQFLGSEDSLDGRADLYALGVTLYQACTGENPFPQQDLPSIYASKLMGEIPHVRTLRPTLPPFVDALVAALMAREPGQRPANTTALLRALDIRSMDPGDGPIVGNLAPTDNAFVGRDALLDELDALTPGAHVTLTGPGGMGKTRLARHVGWSQRTRWPAGVWFFDLTEATHPDQMATQLAATLSAPLGGHDPMARLCDTLAGRGPALYILDNFEQLTRRADQALARLIAATPTAAWLVTSREATGLAGERVLSVPPLTTDDGIALFCDRANGPVRPDDPALKTLVQELDGLPLAIELAAARTVTFSPAALRAHLRDRLGFLHSDTTERPKRQRTLRDAIAGSWAALSAHARLVLAQCSVFEGGFSLALAEDVLRVPTDGPNVAHVLEHLVARSLVQTARVAGNRRFSLLLSIQAFAREHLTDDRATEIRHGHALARLGTPEHLRSLRHHGGLARLAVLQTELENLSVAAERALDRQDGPVAIACANALGTVLATTGPLRRALELDERCLAFLDRVPQNQQSPYLCHVGERRRLAGQWARAQEAYRLARQRATDPIHTALSLGYEGTLRLMQMDVDRAQEQLEQALAILTPEQHPDLHAIFLGNLSQVFSVRADVDTELQMTQQALALHIQVGDVRSELLVLGNLGAMHLNAGNDAEAVAALERSLSLAEQAGLHEGLPMNLMNLGNRDVSVGQWNRATRHYKRGLAEARRVGDRTTEAYILVNFGQHLADLGQSDRALACFRDARDILDRVGDRPVALYAKIYAGFEHINRKEWDQAMVIADAVNREARALGWPLMQGLAHLCQAEAQLGQGQVPTDALVHAAILDTLSMPFEASRYLSVRARAALLAEDTDNARTCWEQAIARLDGAGQPIQQALYRVSLAEMLLEADPPRALQLLGQAQDVASKADLPLSAALWRTLTAVAAHV